MGAPTEEVVELPEVDGTFEPHDHIDPTPEEIALGHVVYKEVDDLDDESNGLLHEPGKEN